MNPPYTFPPRGVPLETFRLRTGNVLLPGGEPLENFGSLGRMDIYQGRAPLRRGNHSNPSPHKILPREGTPRNKFRGWGRNSPIGKKPLASFGSLGWMDTNQGRTKLGRGGAPVAVGGRKLTEEGGGDSREYAMMRMRTRTRKTTTRQPRA